MDSSDTKSSNSDDKGAGPSSGAGGRKLAGGLSASDLRARLGLKSGGKGGVSSLGPAPSPSPNAIPGLPENADETSQIEKSVLESLRKDIGVPRKGSLSAPSLPQAPSSENSTQALSIDDLDDLLVDEPKAPAGATVPSPAVGTPAASADADDAGFGARKPTALSHSLPKAERSMEPGAAISGSAALTDSPVPEDDIEELSLSSVAGVIEEEPDDAGAADDDLAGEATQMLNTDGMFDDEEEFDAFPDGEATQIMMPAMDYDPLTGKLIVEAGEAPQSEYILARDKTSIGRGNNNGVIVPDIAMSRRHLVFERYAEGFIVRDLDSGNGTFVNGRRVVYAQLRNGDQVEVGNLTVRFEQSGGDPAKLWKGDPEIQYHDKDTGPGGGPARSLPSAPAAPVHPQQQQIAQPQVLLQQQHPNAMMQQQMMMSNPNMPGFNPAMGPYGQMPGYPPGYTQQGLPQAPQKRSGSPVVTALIVFFSVLLIGLLGLISWSVYEQYGGGGDAGSEEQAGESEESKRQRADEFARQGIQLFDQHRWDESLEAFKQALALAPDHPDAKIYADVIPEEKDNHRRIKSALKDVGDSPSIGTFDAAVLVLKGINPDSTFAEEVRTQHLPKVKELYKKFLLREADKAIQSGNFIKAKRHLTKIEADLEIKDDPEVDKMVKKMEDKQSASN